MGGEARGEGRGRKGRVGAGAVEENEGDKERAFYSRGVDTALSAAYSTLRIINAGTWGYVLTLVCIHLDVFDEGAFNFVNGLITGNHRWIPQTVRV